MFKQSCYVNLLEYNVYPLIIAAVTSKKDIFNWCLNHFIEDNIINKVIINLKISERYGAMETDHLCMLKTLNEEVNYDFLSNTNNFN